jgi:ABC-type multidrug transport system fused ATPase/permease subunit
LLDDPLSAVDAPTARFLVDHAIRRMLKGRTCILVSHAVGLVLPFADYVVAVRNGEVLAQGTPNDVVQNPAAEGIYGVDLAIDLDKEALLEIELAQKAPIVLPDKLPSKLVDEEERATGSVRLFVYKTYFTATGGIYFFILFAMSFLICQAVQFGNDWWLKNWTDSTAKVPQVINMTLPSSLTMGKLSVQNDYFSEMQQGPSLAFFPIPRSHAAVIDPPTHDAMYYISIYGLFGLAVITAVNLQTLIYLFGSLVASRRMHNTLLNNILGAPLRFFEVTPIGRILNRFSKDIQDIDSMVIEAIYYFVAKVLQGLTTLFVIATVVPPFLIVVVPIIFVYMWISDLYLKVSRELKRLDAVSRSPIYAQFSETLAGVTTIRAYGSEARFVKMNEDKVDANHRAFFYLWTANRWLCFRTDLISAFVVLFAGMGVMTGKLGPGWAGLVLTYALDFTQALLWTVRMHAEMEMALNSVERVAEYSAIEQEPAAHIEETKPKGEVYVHFL